jgi:hypothetical protein
MKRFVLVIALTGLMSVTALAGEIPTNGAAAPTPPPTTSSTASTSSTVLVTVILTVLGLR